MSTIIFIFGLAIGVSAFLYLYPVITGGIKKIQKTGPVRSKMVKQNIQPETIGFKGRKSYPPGTRICPLCGSELTKYEGLYASRITEKSENKILIMGCKYCFKDK